MTPADPAIVAAPTDATTAAIEVESLVKVYPGGVRALDGLGFTVQEGTIFGLLGPNGAGKSTTVKVLTTLSRPTSGSARVAGHDVLLAPSRVRRSIGVVAQRSGVDPEATGRENLSLQGHLYGLRGARLRARVDELLRRYGLADAGDRVTRTYSGGMQRKLDIATALVHHPQVLFLDEPTTGLDPEARAEVWEQVAALAGAGLTILLTTHYLEEADRLAARLAIVDRGRLVVSGTPEELKGQLRGDAIHIELAEAVADGIATGALERLENLREVTLDGRALHARADNGATAVPGALAALEASGVPVASVTVARPSLDDVYLRHTGRAFSEADAEDRKEPRQ